LELKNAAVSDLQDQLAKVEASLANAASEADEYRVCAIKDSEDAKAALEVQLEEKQNELEKVQAQLEEVTVSLHTVQKEVGGTLISPIILCLCTL
jgi:septal ring factor EnvC (AmiA/AmiB activator)